MRQSYCYRNLLKLLLKVKFRNNYTATLTILVKFDQSSHPGFTPRFASKTKTKTKTHSKTKTKTKTIMVKFDQSSHPGFTNRFAILSSMSNVCDFEKK